jgi:uncharacterized protein DUF4390
MGFIMRGSRSYKFFLLFGCFCLSTTVFAADFGVTISRADLAVRNGWYVLNADVDFQLSPTAILALQNGIPLQWTLLVKVLRKRRILWDKEVFQLRRNYRIRYHALMNMYQLKAGENGDADNFSILSGAIARMGNIRDLPLLRKKELRQDDYIIAVKIQFDKEELPLPIRPEAYIKSEWSLSSDWYQWLIEK